MTAVKHEPLAEAGQQNNVPASLYSRSRPGQGFEDQIRTFQTNTVPGSSRWRMVPVGALANRPKVHHSWLTEETECDDYGILCVTREVKVTSHMFQHNQQKSHACNGSVSVRKKDVSYNVMLAIAFL